MTSIVFQPPAGQAAMVSVTWARAFGLGAPGGKQPIAGAHGLAEPSPSSTLVRRETGPAPETPSDQHPSIEVADWDVLFVAVEARLRQAVGDRLEMLPETPTHSAQLTASLVQAIVLDCVDALHKLHAAVKHDRSPRPTA